MVTLTEIWNMPRSLADYHIKSIYKVDIKKLKEERQPIYDVEIIYRNKETFRIEAASEKEAIKEAMDELGINERQLIEAKIL